MRWITAATLLLMAAFPGAARAQFADLIWEAEGLPPGTDRQITLDLRGVPAQEAVARLAAEGHLPLRCDPQLSARVVTLVVRDRRTRAVAYSLACALAARWRKQGVTSVLEPAYAVETLTPQEVAVSLQRAFPPSAQPSGPPGSIGAGAEKLRHLLAPGQREALDRQEAVPVSALSPMAQQETKRLVAQALAGSLAGLCRGLAETDESLLQGTTVHLQGSGDDPTELVFMNAWRLWHLPLRVATPMPGRPPASTAAEGRP